MNVPVILRSRHEPRLMQAIEGLDVTLTTSSYFSGYTAYTLTLGDVGHMDPLRTRLHETGVTELRLLANKMYVQHDTSFRSGRPSSRRA
jgi:WD40 repeat protein